jgi:hypothetical protein
MPRIHQGETFEPSIKASMGFAMQRVRLLLPAGVVQTRKAILAGRRGRAMLNA